MFFFLSSSAQQKNFTFDTELQKASESLFALRLDDADSKLESYGKNKPDNLLRYLLEDYSQFLRAFITEDKAGYDAYEKENDETLKQLRTGNSKTAWYRYAIAEATIHRAMIQGARGMYYRSTMNIKDAYALLKENIKQYPDFIPQYKSIGALEIMAASVPSGYQWLAGLIGFSGNMESGKARLNKVITNIPKDEYLKATSPEILFLYAYVYQQVLKKPDEAWTVIDAHTADFNGNLLKCYTRAFMAAKCKKNETVISAILTKPTGNGLLSFPQLEYLLGNAYLYKHQFDLAEKRYLAFLNLKTKGNHRKSAWLRLVWVYTLQGNKTKADQYLNLLKASKEESSLEDDKQAVKEANAFMSNSYVLSARLFFDGGYYHEAMSDISKVNESQFAVKKERLDYLYRKARILHEMRKVGDAIKAYEKVIEEGKEESWYYAAYASLYLGNLFEESNMKNMARVYYEQVFDFPNKEYQNSIEQKAKAGLERIK